MSINVLSLCDGLSVAQIALREAGIEYGYYVASEIDKYTIKATQHNFPATIQIGDIRNVRIAKIPFKIDLIVSGTPCTSFSGAGKMDGFSADTGQLFFEFCRILKEAKAVNPKVKFLFENVAFMKKEVKDIITMMLGVEPIKIDSALVSAQTRKRYYWHNFGTVTQPIDRGIVIQDILEDNVDKRYHLSETILKRINKDAVLKELYRLKLQREKSRAIISSVSRTTDREYFTKNQGQLVQVNPAKEFGDMPRQQHRKHDAAVSKSPTLSVRRAGETNIVTQINKSQDGKDFAVSGKSQCLSAGHGNAPKIALAGAIRGRYTDNGSITQRMELNNSSKSIALTTVEKDNIVICSRDGKIKRSQNKAATVTVGGHGAGNHSDMDVLKPAHPLALGVVNDKGILRSGDKALCIDANYYKGMDNHAQRSMIIHEEDYELIIRRLTEVEVCRLQGIPQNYFYNHGKLIISSTQVYKSAGNAWQADTIAHILSFYKATL